MISVGDQQPIFVRFHGVGVSAGNEVVGVQWRVLFAPGVDVGDQGCARRPAADPVEPVDPLGHGGVGGPDSSVQNSFTPPTSTYAVRPRKATS